MTQSNTTAVTGAPTASVRLSLGAKLAFGAGDLSPAIATLLISFFQFFFLTTVAGLDPLRAGSVRAILSVWDAVNDPAIGWLSDRTRSRWGRRRPWILFGAVPFGVLYFLQWLVPPFDDTGKFIYYLVVGLLFNIAFTMVNVPYTALTAELTQDYDERTNLNAFRFAFSIGGSLIAGVLHPIITGNFPNDQMMGYLVSGAVWGGLCMLPFLWCFAGVREREHPEAEAQPASMPEQLRAVFSNRPYLFVIGIYLCSWLAVQFTSTILVPYVTFWLRQPNLISLMLLAVQGSAFIFLFVWSAVSRRLGKQAVYVIGMIFWIVVQAVLFFVPADGANLALVLAVLAGVGVATAYIVPWSMMPDVIEYNELHTGQRREGVFYGLMVLLQKFGLALGQFLLGLVLQLAGYISSEGNATVQQPESALVAIRLMIGPAPAVVLLVGIVLALRYPITRKQHEETLELLAKRRGAGG